MTTSLFTGLLLVYALAWYLLVKKETAELNKKDFKSHRDANGVDE